MTREQFLNESFHFRKQVKFCNIPVDVLAVDYVKGKVLIHTEDTDVTIHEWVTIDRVNPMEGDFLPSYKIGDPVVIPGKLLGIENLGDLEGTISDIGIKNLSYLVCVDFIPDKYPINSVDVQLKEIYQNKGFLRKRNTP